MWGGLREWLLILTVCMEDFEDHIYRGGRGGVWMHLRGVSACACVCVCVCMRVRERVSECVCVCVLEGDEVKEETLGVYGALK